MSGLVRRGPALVARAAAACRETRSLKGKSNASARWVRRQWSDPVVKQAKREGLRSRAAFKLRELNAVRRVPRLAPHARPLTCCCRPQKHQLIKRGDVVLDLGAAPGGWTQVGHPLRLRLGRCR